MPDIVLPILLTWHLTSVIVWLGLSATFVFIISPSLRSMNMQDRRLFLRSFLPRFSKLISTSSVSTLIAGTFLFGYVSSSDTSYNPTGWRLIFISIGAVLGIVAIILTLGVFVTLSSRFVREEMANEHISVIKSGTQSTKTSQAQATFGAIISVMTSITLILGVVLILMTLGVYF